MKKVFISAITAVLAVFVLNAEEAKPQFPESITDCLNELRHSKATVGNLGKLYTTWKNLDTAKRNALHKGVMDVVGAGLLSIGEIKSYKGIRDQMVDVKQFENSVSPECRFCDNSGRLFRKCYECKGNGRCTNCQGNGYTYKRTLLSEDYDYVEKRCNICSGSGKCKQCKGKGGHEEPCQSCQKIEQRFSKDKANAKYLSSIDSLFEMKEREIKDIAAAKERAKQEAEREAAKAQARAEREAKEEVAKAICEAAKAKNEKLLHLTHHSCNNFNLGDIIVEERGDIIVPFNGKAFANDTSYVGGMGQRTYRTVYTGQILKRLSPDCEPDCMSYRLGKQWILVSPIPFRIDGIPFFTAVLVTPETGTIVAITHFYKQKHPDYRTNMAFNFFERELREKYGEQDSKADIASNITQERWNNGDWTLSLVYTKELEFEQEDPYDDDDLNRMKIEKADAILQARIERAAEGLKYVKKKNHEINDTAITVEYLSSELVKLYDYEIKQFNNDIIQNTKDAL